MRPVDPKTYLWKTVTCRLGLPVESGVDAVFPLLKDGGISRGTVQRLKAGETSVGVDQLSKLAAFFKIEVWELLVPPGTTGKPTDKPTEPVIPHHQLEDFKAFNTVATKTEREAFFERYEVVMAAIQGAPSGGAPAEESKRKAANG